MSLSVGIVHDKKIVLKAAVAVKLVTGDGGVVSADVVIDKSEVQDDLLPDVSTALTPT